MEKLGFENDLLRAHIASVQSADSLMARARELGYKPLQIDQIEFMEVSGFSLPSSPGQQAQPLESDHSVIGIYDETLAHWFMRQIPKWGLIKR